MAQTLIGSIRLTPAGAQPGESVLVEVLDPQGEPLDPSADVVVNGVRGTRRYTQFKNAGEFSLIAVGRQGGVTESASTSVTVEVAQWPEVEAAPEAGQVKIPDSVRRFPLLSIAPARGDSTPYELKVSANDTPEFAANISRLYREQANLAEGIDKALAVVKYEWDFGDGASATTNVGDISHDFSAALSIDEEHRLLDVTCTIETADAGSFSVTRTLSVVNAYAVCRNRGVVAPRITQAEQARKVLTAFEATIGVENLEAESLSLTRQRVDYTVDDVETMGSIKKLPKPFLLKPHAVTLLNLAVPFTNVPAEATGINVVLLGKDSAGRDVHVETYLDVALPDTRTDGLLFKGVAVTRIAAVGLADIMKKNEIVINPVIDPVDKEKVAEEAAKVIAEKFNGDGLRVKRIDALNLAVMKKAIDADKVAEVGKGAKVLKGGKPPMAGLLNFPLQKFTAMVQGDDDFAGLMRHVADNAQLRDAVLAEHTDIDIAKAAEFKEMFAKVKWAYDWATVIRDQSAPSEGVDCDPDNLPDVADDAWTCQISRVGGQDEIIEWHRHAGFSNARKGDLLLAPGGPAGFVGGLLRQVIPPQHYGHMGIMTRNHDMITHSTFAEERLDAHYNGSIELPFGLAKESAPTDGFEPDVLKYGWPGVITQWVTGAVAGGRLADLENMPAPGQPETEIDAVDPDKKVHSIKPFNKYAATNYADGEWEIIPPLVVKPSPLEETPEIRRRLHAIADAALAATGKSHYRFYCYTDGAFGLANDAPAGPEWPAATFPSVCSSFIWTLLSKAGIFMEGELEPTDVAAGAEVKEDGHDGLYLYRAHEREIAANWLHNKLKTAIASKLGVKIKQAAAKAGVDLTDQIVGLAGDLVETLTDIGDDAANQLVNAFASDDTSTAAKDSEAWKHLADSLAISPDNTMFWDPPSKGGLYGCVVPATFVPARIDRAPRYTWQYVPNRGALSGVVRVAGALKGGALVQISDAAGQTGFTGSDGRYRLPKVPFGSCMVTAQWDQGDGMVVEGQVRVEMNQVEQTLDIDLQRSAKLYRRLHCTCDMRFMKYYVKGKNPRQSFHVEFDVDVTPEPGRTTAKQPRPVQDFHGIFGAGSFLFILQPQGVVQASVAWAVSQDGDVVEKMADSLSTAVEDLSLGFIDNLFGHEVNGVDQRTGAIDPNGPPFIDSILIGDQDGTYGRLSFKIENLGP